MSYGSALMRLDEIRMRAAIMTPGIPTWNPRSAATETTEYVKNSWEEAQSAASGTSGGTAVLGVSAPPSSMQAQFRSAAARHGVPEELLMAVAKAESGFRADARSSVGAQGIMQLMPATARGLGVSNPLDPEQSINGGAKYLAQMLDRFNGNYELALAAYNAGPNAVERYGGVPPYKETQNYVRKVLDYAKAYGLQV